MVGSCCRLGVALGLVIATATASAHFPWLAVDQAGHVRFFFGENLNDRDYHLPDGLSGAEVWQVVGAGKGEKVAVEDFEEEGFIGLRSSDPAEAKGQFVSSSVYGLYHGAKLTYFTQHFPSAANAWPSEATKSLDLQAVPRWDGNSLNVQVLWKGKPLTDAKVSLYAPEGIDGDQGETDSDGRVTFDIKEGAEGLFGILVGFTDKEETGTYQDEDYKGASYYLTTTFNLGGASTAAQKDLPPLPEALASFGAARVGPWLYVYSGHTGKPHDHCKECLSKHFRRLNLETPSEWEELPSGPPLQGVPLVACDGKLYRIGGLSAKNSRRESADLHSVASVDCFDPSTKEWSAMPALPEARSSHDAFALGSEIYVVGGWRLAGDDQEWLETAYKIDTAAPNPAWTALPTPPFQRRAIATVIADGKLYVIGGMDEDNQVSNEVDVLDLKTGTWSEAPAVPCGRMKAFGVAAVVRDDQVYVSTHDRQIHRLNQAGDAWEAVGTLAEGRIFHRLLPASDGTFVVAGGASGMKKQLTSVLEIAVP